MLLPGVCKENFFMDSSDACQECDTGTECEAPGVTLDELPLQVRGVSEGAGDR